MGLFGRKRQRWDFVWQFPDGLLIELRASDPLMSEFEARKNELRSQLKKGEISSGEYIERFKGLCIELGTRLDSVPQGYSLSKEYSVARVFSKKADEG